MANLQIISVSINPALLAEATTVAKARKISMDQLIEEALEALLEREDDAFVSELVEKRKNDPEIEVTLDELVAGISDANIHRSKD